MSTNKLKSFAQRGSMLVAAAALVAATFAPAAVFANGLTPLTERSLLLSSSAPGWQDTDGSGYSTEQSNPGYNGDGTEMTGPNGIPKTFAPAGSGANGRKTGQTFTFRISTPATEAAPIKGFSLQYCTTAAGLCQAPGDNSGDARNSDRKTNAAALTDGDNTSDLDVNYTSAVAGTDYKIFVNNVEVSNYTGWALATQNVEDDGYNGTPDSLTGKNNYIALTNSEVAAANNVGGITDAAANAQIKIVFVASESNYITNPGSGSFFVKMNTWNTETLGAATPGIGGANYVPGGANNIDGGVTVANVMADSIHITTKVLETMSFSVGTTNPDSIAYDIDNEGQPDDGDPDASRHGVCDIIEINNRIDLGNVAAENSLQTDRGYGAHSYWRLSSNSSGGATVYYSGETLTNTVGDIINAIGIAPNTRTLSNPGTEQFGLAFDMVANTSGLNDETNRGNYIHESEYSDSFALALPIINVGGGTYAPGLNVLSKSAAYADGNGSLGVRGTGAETAQAYFAFDRNSVSNPVAIADNVAGGGGVLGCETGKMRYVANIAPSTPAGVYTTKINYLAAPQY